MEWSNKEPTEPGWYWWRQIPGEPGEIMFVRLHEAGALWLCTSTNWIDAVSVLTKRGSQWSGPLQEPSDPQEVV